MHGGLQGRGGEGDEHIGPFRERGVDQAADGAHVALGITDGHRVIAPLDQARVLEPGEHPMFRFFDIGDVGVFDQMELPLFRDTAGRFDGGGCWRVVTCGFAPVPIGHEEDARGEGEQEETERESFERRPHGGRFSF